MRIWTFIKLLAALAVLGVMGFTGALAYHITVRPLGGIFEKLIPNPADVVPKNQPETDVAKMLDAPEMPDVEPGEKAFQKAVELVAMGSVAEAREKLETIVNIYPTSSAAPQARRIVGDMNLDELLSPENKEGKQQHVVQRGESFLSIANKHKTTLDCIMMLNGLTEFGGLQPGDDLEVMPLDFRLLIEPDRQSISLWQGGRFLKEYPIVRSEPPHAGKTVASRTTISAKSGYLNGKQLQPTAKGYRESEKIIQLAKSPVQLRPLTPSVEKDTSRPRGLYLKPADMEELTLLTRVGNEVEIRPSAR